MAASDPVAPLRSQLLVGDVSFNRALSESLFNKVAGETNFINSYQAVQKDFKINGKYFVSTSLFFFDGAIPFFYNSEIVGISFENGTVGASGITELDLIWINAAGVEQGSIFSTTPKIASTAQNKAVVLRNLVTGNDSGPTTGITLPVLSKTTFLEGESVYAKLNSAMSGAINCGISVFYRPIN